MGADATRPEEKIIAAFSENCKIILRDGTRSGAAKSAAIIKLLASIPAKHQNAQTYDSLFKVCYSLFSPPSPVSLSKTETSAIFAEIIGRHLYFLSLTHEYHYKTQLRRYESEYRELLGSTTFSIILNVVIPKLRTTYAKGVEEKATTNTMTARIGERPQPDPLPADYFQRNKPRWRLDDLERDATFALASQTAYEAKVQHDLAEKEISDNISKISRQIVHDISFWNYGRVLVSFGRDTPQFSYHQLSANSTSNKRSYLKQEHIIKAIMDEPYRKRGIMTLVIWNGLIMDRMPTAEELSDDAHYDPDENGYVDLPEPEITDCSKIDESNDEAFIECLVRQRESYAEQLRFKAMSAGFVLHLIAETFNPMDALSLATMGTAKIVAGSKLMAGLIAAAPVVVIGQKNYRRIKTMRAIKIAWQHKWGAKEAERLTNAFKSRGAIGKLSKEMQGQLFGNFIIEHRKYYQVHHVITIQSLKEHDVIQAAVLRGFEINNPRRNGFALLRQHHSLLHIADYNKWLDQKITLWKRVNPHFTQDEAYEFVQNLGIQAIGHIKQSLGGYLYQL